LLKESEICGKNRHLQHIYACFTDYICTVLHKNMLLLRSVKIYQEPLVLYNSNSNEMERGNQRQLICQTEFFSDQSNYLSVIQGFCFSIRLFPSSL